MDSDRSQRHNDIRHLSSSKFKNPITVKEGHARNVIMNMKKPSEAFHDAEFKVFTLILIAVQKTKKIQTNPPANVKVFAMSFCRSVHRLTLFSYKIKITIHQFNSQTTIKGITIERQHFR